MSAFSKVLSVAVGLPVFSKFSRDEFQDNLQKHRREKKKKSHKESSEFLTALSPNLFLDILAVTSEGVKICWDTVACGDLAFIISGDMSGEFQFKSNGEFLL